MTSFRKRKKTSGFYRFELTTKSSPYRLYPMNILQVIPFIQHYAWGDLHSIPQLLKQEPDGSPWAELWIGTHPKGPARIISKQGTISLQEYIQTAPLNILGKAAERFNGELPFLFKILAVGKPLSIQCHPTKIQAEEGFLKENSAGIDINSFNRSYKDDNHKPEILCALTPFTALCGFRPAQEIDSFFSCLNSDIYKTHLNQRLCNKTKKEADRYKAFFSALIRLPVKEKGEFLKDLAEAAKNFGGIVPEFQLVRQLLEEYPGDPSAAAPLYLNLIKLQPGEALYQPAGELHAYIHGVGVELMANSDNVLRGGLTGKFIDSEELMHVVEFKGTKKEKTLPVRNAVGDSKRSDGHDYDPDHDGLETYLTPAKEFQLSRVPATSSVTMENRESMEILICTLGRGSLNYYDNNNRSQTELFETGTSLVVPACINEYSITTDVDGVMFIAGIPGETV